jgi:hypothetical protein
MEMKNKIVITDSVKKVNKKTLFKGLIIMSMLTVVFLNCIYGFGLPSSEIECIEDVSHKYTENINTYMHENKNVTNAITIFSSICIDIIMVSMSVHWVLQSDSWRLIVCLVHFYLFRGFIQGMFQMKYPQGFIWEYPGLPSLAVSYLKTNDFFYSGHCGLPIIAACEFFAHRKYLLGFFSIFGCVVEFIVMTIMRGHYIIDLIFGIITAHYFFIIVDRFIYIIDNSYFTLKEREKISKKNSIQNLKKSLEEKSDYGDCKDTTSSSDDDVNKYY